MITVNKNGKDFSLTYAEHMLHHKNLESVLLNGLLSHNAAHSKELIKEDISMPEVQRWRTKVPYVNGFPYFKPSIHDLVSFYFNSKNPMLYKRKEMQPELVIILISADILDSKKTDSKFAVFSDGNAGSSATKFFIGKDNLTNVDFELIFSGSWNNEDAEIKKENVRKMCSEVLVYPSVSVADIQKIICPNQTMYDYVTNLKTRLGSKVSHIIVEQQTGYFF